MSLFNRLANLFRRDKLQREIEAELAAHLAMRSEDNRAAGMSLREAQLDARRRFGSLTAIGERIVAADAALALDRLGGDLRYALRQLRKSPGFTVTVVLTLALSIGATAAIFSAVEAVLLRPLPFENPDRLVVVWQSDPAHPGTGAFFNSYREFEVWKEHSRSFEKLTALTWAGKHAKTLFWHNKPIDVFTVPVSTDFFGMLGVTAQIGRTFAPSDLSNSCTLVLAYPFWQQKLGEPKDIVGQSLAYGNTQCQIIGVMPRSFAFYPMQTAAWSLITPQSEFVEKPWGTMTGAFGLLKPGVTRQAAVAELTALENTVLPEAPSELRIMRNWKPVVLDLQSNFTWLAGRSLRQGLWLLLGASGLILLMSTVNVSGLLLGRGIEREREMAVRAALGSGRRRLIAQALTESALLAFFGTSAGLVLAWSLIRWFRAINPIELPPGSAVTLDWRVLAFTTATGIFSAVAFGLYPAWRGSRIDLNSALKSSGHAHSPAASAQRVAKWMVVAQVALSMVLVTGASLFAESLWKFMSTELGYRTQHLFTARLNLPSSPLSDRYTDQASRERFASNLEAELTALPGIKSVALGSDFIPMDGEGLSIEGDAATSNGSDSAVAQYVSPRFFSTMQIPLLRGRVFDVGDREHTQPVVIVNQAFVNKYFPGKDPIGRAIKLAPAGDSTKPWMSIIGIAGDVKTTTIFRDMVYEESPSIYVPLAQSTPASLAFMLAGEENDLALASQIQQLLSHLDRSLLLSDIDGLHEEHISDLRQPRFRTVLFASFAGLALVLALVGLCGVLTQLIVRRRREIGVRMALGANRESILSSVLRQACVMTTAGVAIGAFCAVAEVRLIHSLLYEIRAWGVAEFACAAAALLIVALAAAWFPARRAASIDPMEALRSE
ncbi:ADOP family duplicated permease [Acidicapsa dinghuensis]|uniref:ADOP family duplicated permease n=1 Tax=Acidicapsa dinghuensis TaxID=2218256 RepID=A0ABW1EJB7_9BACT|nr:ABC transporter permease [Acidicapsa dinghuensis]